MASLDRRRVQIQIGQPGQLGRQYRVLACQFRVLLTDRGEPDSCRLQLYNVAPASVAAAQADGAVLRLLAGYDTPQLLFAGDIDEAYLVRRAPDTVLDIEATDSGRIFREAHIVTSIRTETTLEQIIRTLASAMGVPLTVFRVPTNRRYPQGVVLYGSVAALLDQYTRDAGVRWALEGGELHVMAADAAVSDQAPLLSPATGLIGAPERAKGGWEFRCTLNPALRPRRRFRVESRTVTGIFRAASVEHVGEPRGGDFLTTVTAREA